MPPPLQGVTREPNTVARLGGDEFAILLPKVAGQEAAVAMAHKLLRTLHMLNHIAGIGVRFSIDDFGTGYSSLSYLSKLPVCELKIDKSFVVDMVGSDSDAVIVRTTVDLGHNLGLKVVAEGVESEAILARLKALGCDGAQGYHIGYPLSEANFASWIKQTNWTSS